MTWWRLVMLLPHKPTDAVDAKTTVGILPSDYKAFSTSKHQGSKSWSNRWIIMYEYCLLFTVHIANTIHAGPRIYVPMDSDRVSMVDPEIAVHRAAATAPQQAGPAITPRLVSSCRESDHHLPMWSIICHLAKRASCSMKHINRHSPNREDGFKSKSVLTNMYRTNYVSAFSTLEYFKTAMQTHKK